MHFKELTNLQTLKLIDCSEITIEGMADVQDRERAVMSSPNQLGWAWFGSGGLHAKAGVRPTDSRFTA